MKIKLETMESIILDLGRDITIMKYREGLIITDVEKGKSKIIKWSDLK